MKFESATQIVIFKAKYPNTRQPKERLIWYLHVKDGSRKILKGFFHNETIMLLSGEKKIMHAVLIVQFIGCGHKPELRGWLTDIAWHGGVHTAKHTCCAPRAKATVKHTMQMKVSATGSTQDSFRVWFWIQFWSLHAQKPFAICQSVHDPYIQLWHPIWRHNPQIWKLCFVTQVPLPLWGNPSRK